MTDDDLQIFLTLKFTSIGAAMDAFKIAIHEPKGHLIKNPSSESIINGIRKWTEAGCPTELEIADEDIELFLIVKFGSISAAHHHWVNTPPGNPHGLNGRELNVVLDYLPDDLPRS